MIATWASAVINNHQLIVGVDKDNNVCAADLEKPATSHCNQFLCAGAILAMQLGLNIQFPYPSSLFNQSTPEMDYQSPTWF